MQSSANLRLAYLKQEFAESLVSTRTLREELLSAFVEEQQILADIAQCEQELAQTVTDTVRMDAVLARMQRLHDLADAKQCYALAARVDKVMASMGFAPEDGQLLVGSFSGGWKMRIGLAKILLLDPYVHSLSLSALLVMCIPSAVDLWTNRVGVFACLCVGQ